MTVILNSKMNMRRFYVSAALLLTTLLAVAENNPYRSDVFWVTVPDHADWLYKTGEQANVEVQFYKYGIPGDSIAINFEIGGEMMPADTKGTVIMRKGKATIPVGTMKKPGFRDCRLTTTVDGKKYSHHVKVGFSPEKLRPYTTMPADFQQFWENEKAELAKFPLTYTKEHVKKYSTDQIDCYLIKLQVNQRGQSIYGYLFYPKKEGKYPVVLCPPGAGIKTIKEPLRHKYYAEQGCIRFEIEIHGLNPEMSEEEFKEISAAFNGRENGYLSNGLDSRDNYYMKRVYLACVRSIDLLTSLPEWDGKNVIVQGGSQGGALALVTAGLDIVAKILNKYLRMDLGRAMSLSGMCVALSAALVYDKKTVVLSILGTYFNGIILDHFIFDHNKKRRVCIITEKEEALRQFIINELHSGATIYEAIGAYNLQKHNEIITIVDKSEYQRLMTFINREDPKAFITVYNVSNMQYQPKIWKK